MLASHEGGAQTTSCLQSSVFSLHSLRVFQIKRAQVVKSHYLQSQQHILAQKKQEAVEKATPGGIMGLNLIALQHQESEGNGNENGSDREKQPKPAKSDKKAQEKPQKDDDQ